MFGSKYHLWKGLVMRVENSLTSPIMQKYKVIHLWSRKGVLTRYWSFWYFHCGLPRLQNWRKASSLGVFVISAWRDSHGWQVGAGWWQGSLSSISVIVVSSQDVWFPTVRLESKQARGEYCIAFKDLVFLSLTIPCLYGLLEADKIQLIGRS